MPNKIHLIDGSGFVHRFYHALPKFQRSDGLEVGALRGFAEMLWRATRVMDATHVAVIMDGGRSHRNDIWPLYKSNRPEVDAELRMQIPLLDAACEAFGVAVHRVPDHEADDTIATLTAKADEDWGGPLPPVVTIHSGDKDFYQIMSPLCRIYDPHPKRNRILDVMDCIKKFGVPPYQVACAQGLIGDSTDCIPGVPEIGPVAASKLLSAHGTLDEILAVAAHGKLVGLNKKQARSFVEPHQKYEGLTGIELAKISRQLATLKHDLDLGFGLDDIVRKDTDKEKLDDWLAEMEFTGLATKIEFQAA